MYVDLYKAWKNEKTFTLPQPLPQDFYRRTENYLRGLDGTQSSDSPTLQSQLNQREKEVANRLFQELKEARTRKIITAARDGIEINTEALTEDEKKLVKNLNESLKPTNISPETKAVPAEQDRVTLSIVRFLEDIPEIVGTDLRIYGPYKKEDVGSIPSQNAEALMKQGAAKMIEVKNMPQAPPRKL